MFRHFSGGRNDELVPLWAAGEITTRECLRREAAMVCTSEEEMNRFLDRFWLNYGFEEFVDLCRSADIDLTIMSDGLDFYIRYILNRYGFGDLPLMTNIGRLNGDGSMVVEFPFDNRECARCGSCKGERIKEYRERHDGPVTVAFVGDGYSDICALGQADIVLAKKDLEEYCRQHNIAHAPYDDFHDVIRYLQGRGYLTLNTEDSDGAVQ
jgi:2,3-diketo-5-methylthio-1-phosphopentane phosphatase